MTRKQDSDVSIERSSGNIFTDLGLKEPVEAQTKVQLAVAINQILDEMDFTQTASAKLLNINQPKISALSNYRLAGFSVERLLSFLNALGRDIEIVIGKPRSGRVPGTIKVKAA